MLEQMQRKRRSKCRGTIGANGLRQPVGGGTGPGISAGGGAPGGGPGSLPAPAGYGNGLARGLVASEYWTLIREVLVGDLESAKASLEDMIGVEPFRVG